MATTNNPWQINSETPVYNNPWIEVTEFEVINPGGGTGIYGKVHFKNIAIGIVALDENLNTYLVGQYRFPLNEYSWEIPEGGGNLDAEPIESAKRELLEETGITARNWLLIQRMHLSNSVSDEVALIYLARDLSFGKSQPEETEQLTIKKLAFNEAFRMVCNGTITDSMSVAGILKVKLMLLDGTINAS